MGAGEFMIGTDIGVDTGVGKAAEEEEETGCCSRGGQSSCLLCVARGGKECI
jgi:hypothetical protein